MTRKSVEEFNMKAVISLLIIYLCSTNSAYAGERYHFYNGVRALGMGGASVATVNDETALISNPAALGKLRDYYITLIDPELELGVETERIVGTGVVKSTDPQFALDKTNLKPDKHLHTRAQIFPSIVVPNFGVGLFVKSVVDAQVDSVANKFSYHYTSDYAIVAGLNFRLWNGIIKLGVNARATNRTEVHDDTIDPTSTGLVLKDMASSGLGVGSDAGLILTAPIAGLPTLAAVYRDLGRTTYSLQKGMFMTTTDRPTSTPGTIDVGLSVQPIMGKRSRSTWTVELQDVQNLDKEKDIMRRAHAGVEFNIADAFFIRGGMNQRYWTAGIELSMMNYQFQVASYGEDIGPDQTPREDRRYDAKFSFRF